MKDSSWINRFESDDLNDRGPVVDLMHPAPAYQKFDRVVRYYPHVVKDNRQDSKEGHGYRLTAAASSRKEPHIGILIQPYAMAFLASHSAANAPGLLLLVEEKIFVQDGQTFFPRLSPAPSPGDYFQFLLMKNP